MHSSIFGYCILWGFHVFGKIHSILSFICFICCCFAENLDSIAVLLLFHILNLYGCWKINWLNYMKRNILHFCFPYPLPVFCIATFRENVNVCLIVPSSSIRFFPEGYLDRIRSMTEQNLIRLTSLFALCIKWTYSLKCSEENSPANTNTFCFSLSVISAGLHT